MNFRRKGEPSNGLGKQVRKIWNRYLAGDFRLGLFSSVNDMWLMLNQAPFKAFLGAIYIKTLPVLPCCIVQEPPDMACNIRVLDFDMAGFNSELVA